MENKGLGQSLYRKAKKLIPGGTQLLSKRPEMFLPEIWPAYYESAKGCHVTDLEGRKFVDMSLMGVGCAVLGYADPDVNNAVHQAVDNSSMCTLNAPEEVQLAETLIELHPWAEMARYARTGGEAMAQAVRIARASTGRSSVAFCGYHGWSDWYLAANLAENDELNGHLLPGLMPTGVPDSLRGTARPFVFNDVEALHNLISVMGEDLAAIVMEPIRNEKPTPEFLAALGEVRKQTGAVLIVDEITAGFRLNAGGAHLNLGITPDIAVLGKALSNGFPMAAIIGIRDVMEAAQSSFISSTYWTDRTGPAAALALIKKFRNLAVHQHLIHVGEKVSSGWEKAADASGLAIETGGILPLTHFAFEIEKPMVAKTYFTQEMLKRGYLAATAVYASLAHTDEIVDQYLVDTAEVFDSLYRLDKAGDLESSLDGPVCHSGFHRLN